MDDGGGASADRSRLPAGKISFHRLADQRSLFFLVFAFLDLVVGPGTLCTRILRSRGHAHADDRGQRNYAGVAADIFNLVSYIWRRWVGVGVGYRDWSEFAGAGWLV